MKIYIYFIHHPEIDVKLLKRIHLKYYNKQVLTILYNTQSYVEQCET